LPSRFKQKTPPASNTMPIPEACFVLLEANLAQLGASSEQIRIAKKPEVIKLFCCEEPITEEQFIFLNKFHLEALDMDKPYVCNLLLTKKISFTQFFQLSDDHIITLMQTDVHYLINKKVITAEQFLMCSQEHLWALSFFAIRELLRTRVVSPERFIQLNAAQLIFLQTMPYRFNFFTTPVQTVHVRHHEMSESLHYHRRTKSLS